MRFLIVLILMCDFDAYAQTASIATTPYISGSDYMIEFRVINNGAKSFNVKIGELPWSEGIGLFASYYGVNDLMNPLKRGWHISDCGPGDVEVASGGQLCGLVNISYMFPDLNKIPSNSDVAVFWMYSLRHIDGSYGSQKAGGVVFFNASDRSKHTKPVCKKWENFDDLPLKKS